MFIFWCQCVLYLAVEVHLQKLEVCVSGRDINRTCSWKFSFCVLGRQELVTITRCTRDDDAHVRTATPVTLQNSAELHTEGGAHWDSPLQLD
jgi:hypothetical protein